MKRLTFVAVLLSLPLLVIPTRSPRAAQPDWQIHSVWCTRDGGSSGNVYRSSCKAHDQFDSIVACQRDAEKGHPGNLTSVQVINAGRPAVNAFMVGKALPECKAAPPPPPAQPYYMTARFDCKWNDGTPAGDCTTTTRSANSCAEAKTALLRQAASAGDGCKICDPQRSVKSPTPNWIQDGPCRGQK